MRVNRGVGDKIDFFYIHARTRQTHVRREHESGISLHYRRDHNHTGKADKMSLIPPIFRVSSPKHTEQARTHKRPAQPACNRPNRLLLAAALRHMHGSSLSKLTGCVSPAQMALLPPIFRLEDTPNEALFLVKVIVFWPAYLHRPVTVGSAHGGRRSDGLWRAASAAQGLPWRQKVC
jgi:hypothetical protein